MLTKCRIGDSSGQFKYTRLKILMKNLALFIFLAMTLLFKLVVSDDRKTQMPLSLSSEINKSLRKILKS